MPKLSIITINLNNCEGLRKTAESIFNQTFTNYEWIVIDGASIDGSVDLIKEYVAKIRAKGISCYWVSEPDSGIYNAMNKGIRVSNGNYLQFLNSGDWLYSNTILDDAFSYNCTEDVFFGTSVYVDEKQGKMFEFGPTTENVSAFQILSTSLPHQASFIKRDLFDKYGYYDESFRITADMNFFYNIIVNHNIKIHYIPQIITYFDGNGISNNFAEILIEETERVITDNLPQRFLLDFRIYNDVILKKETIVMAEKQMADNQKAIRFYNTMMRYFPTRWFCNIMYKLMVSAKKRTK